MSSNEIKQVICYHCQIPLTIKKVNISYEGQTMAADLPACPQCGQVYLSEEVVRGKIHEIEKSLEDK
ncbi:MAG: hypothetical protein GX351_08050 [Peptococcaceae bacterium]|jgi:RNase P subunit RPR2|nr:hypothetical protein [Peptococcaceae bacterium]